jgi:hypothetical protein
LPCSRMDSILVLLMVVRTLVSLEHDGILSTFTYIILLTLLDIMKPTPTARVVVSDKLMES